jgi:hypothetical protein
MAQGASNAVRSDLPLAIANDTSYGLAAGVLGQRQLPF